MVDNAKLRTATVRKICPGVPNSLLNASAVIDTPFRSSTYTPLIKMIIAVIEQTMIVSINGPSIATKPSLTGSVVFAAPCAIVSVPVPASLENIPRRTPIIIMLPSAPPETALPVKASLIISANTPGISAIFLERIKKAAII